MKAKKLVVLFLLAAAIVSTSAFSGNSATKKTGTATKSKAVLKIGILQYESYMYDAIQKFNDTHKGVSISYQTIDYSDEYKNKLTTQLSSGGGPDIIRVDSYFFPGLRKVAASGVFYDMNKLIKKDKSFHLKDYNQKVLNSGVIGEKRYFIPLGYSFHLFYARDGELKKNGISVDGQGFTLENFANAAAKFKEKNKGTGKLFLAIQGGLMFSKLVQDSDLKLIDYKKNEAHFNSPEFINLLNIYKKLNATVYNKITPTISCQGGENNTIYDTSCPEYDSGAALILDNTAVGFWYMNSINQRLKLYQFPTYSGKKKITLEPTVAYAINAKCKHKEEAYEFIKLLMSKEYQTNAGYKRNFSSIPVNRSAYLNNANFYIDNLGNTKLPKLGSDAGMEEVIRAKVESQQKLIEDISVCDNIDSQIYNIIENEVKPFMNGKKNAKQTARTIQDKVELYLNE